MTFSNEGNDCELHILVLGTHLFVCNADCESLRPYFNCDRYCFHIALLCWRDTEFVFERGKKQQHVHTLSNEIHDRKCIASEMKYLALFLSQFFSLVQSTFCRKTMHIQSGLG